MQKFLEKTAEYIYEKHSDELGQIAVVLPNQRANIFLRKHFSKILKQASWSPDFLSIEDFIARLSKLQVLDNLDLIVELYEVHKEIKKQKAESFDTFLQWANTLLHDFNEIDRYLLDADTLFDYLNDVQRIKHWDPKGQGLTELQKKNLQFWSELKDYYHLFKSRLLKKGMSYQGLSYRVAAENISNEFLEAEQFKKVYFIGFNALTKAEDKMIGFFVKKGVGEMLYDSDSYYMKDPIQEAGKFLRPKWNNDKENYKWIFSDFQGSDKTIKVTGLKGNIAQVKAVGSLLKNIPNDELSDTAVILADENLLLPLLQSLPDNVQKANITMGLPLTATSPYLFFQELFQLYLNLERIPQGANDAFYHKNLIKVLENPLIQNFDHCDILKIKNKILQDKLFYLSREKISTLDLADEIKPLFQVIATDVEQLLNVVREFILSAKELNVKDPLLNEYLFQFLKIFNRLEKLVMENKESSINLKSLFSLFRQMASTSTVPFHGEPLQGLQIMGVLESRTLDFKHLIFLSLNEGILPVGKSMNSFIPYDIKVEMGLPSYKEKDAIFAYHFYRILQRSEHIELLYNTQTDSLNGGEESRFIKQLLQEIPEKAPRSKIKETNLSPTLLVKKNAPIVVPKSEKILQQIKDHLRKGMSPSALSTFIACPLDYYYKYLLKLRPLDESEENLQASTFGNIIHSSLEKLYEPYLQQFLSLDIINEIEKRAERTLESSFHHQKFQIATGKNHLIFQVALQYIRNFLSFEKKRLRSKSDKIQLLLMEGFSSIDLELKINEKENLMIKLNGKADRIEKEGNLIRIIDFKTGGSKTNELKIGSYADLLSAEKSKALQLMMYSVIFSSAYPQNSILPSIFFLRSPSKGFSTFLKNEKGLEYTDIEEGKAVILKGISDLLDINIPFAHSTDAKYCDFCSELSQS